MAGSALMFVSASGVSWGVAAVPQSLPESFLARCDVAPRCRVFDANLGAGTNPFAKTCATARPARRLATWERVSPTVKVSGTIQRDCTRTPLAVSPAMKPACAPRTAPRSVPVDTRAVGDVRNTTYERTCVDNADGAGDFKARAGAAGMATAASVQTAAPSTPARTIKRDFMYPSSVMTRHDTAR